MLSTIRKRVDNMMKLSKFNKSNKKRNIIVIGVFLIIGLILVGISYAVYQKEDEIKFINARVGSFETSSSDIELAMTLDGEDIDTPPSKGYYNVTVECDHANGRWDENEWGAVIGNITSNRVKCNVSFESYKLSIQDVKVGDYISMTPTSTSYTPPSELTGCLNDSNCTQNTINPSELNLWRVIKKNEDGTVEVVSEYVSSETIAFYGQTGYMNYVRALNTIAAQFINGKYVSSARHVGYSNQTLGCSSLSVCPSDTGYQTDTNLMKESLGTIASKRIDGMEVGYFVSSRIILPVGNTGYAEYRLGLLNSDGTYAGTTVFTSNPAGGDGSKRAVRVRPILALKSDITITSGDGKSEDSAYQLS